MSYGYAATSLSAVVLAAISSALVIPTVIEAIKSLSRRNLRRKLVVNSEAVSSLADGFLRRGVWFLKAPSTLLMNIGSWSGCCLKISSLLSINHRPGSLETVSELTLAACLAAGALAMLFFAQPLVALGFMALVPIMAGNQAAAAIEKRNTKMREQLPDALQCLGFCFLAGCSLAQAIEQTASETAEPLKSELLSVSDDIQSGLGIREALSSLEQRNELPELHYMAVALEIQHQTGGSLKDLLQSAADSAKTSVVLKRQLQAQTAQARLSYKVVALMPVVLVMLLSVAVDGYADTFFSSIQGLMILITAAVMELSGILIIRKILGVDLG